MRTFRPNGLVRVGFRIFFGAGESFQIRAINLGIITPLIERKTSNYEVICNNNGSVDVKVYKATLVEAR